MAPSPTSPPPGGVPPLYIAMLCILFFIIGVLVKVKKVYAKLWLKDGFPRHRRRRTKEKDPVGQEVSLR